MPVDRSSVEILLAVRRGAGALHAQLEEAVRAGVRDGRLAPGITLPGSRALAAELGVSRSVVTEAYAQLAAEGWLEVGDRRLPRIAAGIEGTVSADAPATTGVESGWCRGDDGNSTAPVGRPVPAPVGIRFDLRPGSPDPALFPRAEWARRLRAALTDLPDAALGYPPPAGLPALRAALRDHLGRVRGVVPTDPAGPLIAAGTSGALALVLQALRATGRDVVAVEDPGHAGVRALVADAGCRVAGVPVDGEGLIVDALPADAGAVLVTPAHQFPTGVVLSPARRAALLAWAVERDAYVLEDDYDAEFRYDRTPVGALQGLAPDRVASMASASKTLAPGLRLGWLTLPPALQPLVEAHRSLADMGRFALDQQAFADLLRRGAYDRHVRRARRAYRERRDHLAAALADVGTVGGVSAGLHLTLTVEDADEAALIAAAAAAGVAVDGLTPHRVTPDGGGTAPGGPATLLVGYGRVPTPSIGPAATLLRDALLAG